MKWYLWKTVFHPPVDKLDIHFILPVGACLWVKENNIQLNEKRMQSSLNCRQSVINNFFFPSLFQEHHLQRAISAQQVYGEKRDNMVIPVPEAERNITHYESLYPGEFKMPKQLIHIQRE